MKINLDNIVDDDIVMELCKFSIYYDIEVHNYKTYLLDFYNIIRQGNWDNHKCYEVGASEYEILVMMEFTENYGPDL